METKELKIQIPEGFEIDKEKSTFEKIVFKKKDTKPRSWEEYCEQCENVPCYALGYDIYNGYWNRQGIYRDGYCIVPSRELAEAFLAMMQLMSLRQAWIRDWEPDWSKGTYCVVATNSSIIAAAFVIFTHPLSFPTQEMATDFMNCFKDLLEIAKPLV